MRHPTRLLIPCLLWLLVNSSCKKDQLLTDSAAKLRFSQDTLLYDTVFVTIGSVTKNVKVYNDYDQPLRISSVRLASGTNFRINVNGQPGKSFSDIEIRPGDSLWIFAEVTVDPNNQLNPYVIKDSIIFETNGHQQDIDLVAWGQNAHFFIASKQNINLPPYVIINPALNSVTTWDSLLPYVVYGGFAVVDSSTTLIITEGTKIHFSNNAGLWVYKGGTLKVQGSVNHRVVFQGLRREMDYAEEPGQWDRIWINDGGNNSIDYAIIKNGFIGLQAETLFAPALPVSLQLTNTIIKNMSGLGLLTRNFTVNSWNTVIANCGLYDLALTLGGNYQFTHCTFADYWNLDQRSTPLFYMNNYADAEIDLNAAFKNCILYGASDNEVQLDIKTSGTAQRNYLFDHCLLKVDSHTPVTDVNHFNSVWTLPAPLFTDIEQNDYQLQGNSFGIDAGDNAFVIPGLTPPMEIDLAGNPRPAGSAVDLGAFEKQ